jgi:predicted nucleic acid-binding protein
MTRAELYLPPLVIAEAFSDPELTTADAMRIRRTPRLEIMDGYWERAGDLRRSLRHMNLKAKLADVLIAQSCIDHDLPLITYDRDFRHFSIAGLKLA